MTWCFTARVRGHFRDLNNLFLFWTTSSECWIKIWQVPKLQHRPPMLKLGYLSNYNSTSGGGWGELVTLLFVFSLRIYCISLVLFAFHFSWCRSLVGYVWYDWHIAWSFLIFYLKSKGKHSYFKVVSYGYRKKRKYMTHSALKSIHFVLCFLLLILVQSVHKMHLILRLPVSRLEVRF